MKFLNILIIPILAQSNLKIYPNQKIEYKKPCISNLFCNDNSYCKIPEIPDFIPKLPTFSPDYPLPRIPSSQPTDKPSNNPTYAPSYIPTNKPSNNPTYAPSYIPTQFPSPFPTPFPTHFPSTFPTIVPTFILPTQPPSQRTFQDKILALVNNERSSRGLNALCFSDKLNSIAQSHSEDQENCNKMSHYSCNGDTLTDRIKNIGYSYRTIGENVAWNQRSPQQVMNAWMNSNGHRANILNPDFTNLGVGLSKKWYWTQVFGKPWRSTGCFQVNDDKQYLYCKCKSNYYTLHKNELCGYHMKSRTIAIILQIFLFPFGVGAFYIHWYTLGFINLFIFIILSTLYIVDKFFNKENTNISLEKRKRLRLYVSLLYIFLNILWFLAWIVAFFGIIYHAIDGNGVPLCS